MNHHNFISFLQFKFPLSILFVLSDEPIISSTEQEFDIVEGSSLTLPCAVTGDPTPAIVWYKDGVQLVSNDMFQIEKDGLLKMKRIKENEEGEYICKATNVIGTSDQVFKLTVKGLVWFIVYLRFFLILKSYISYFICMIGKFL